MKSMFAKLMGCSCILMFSGCASLCGQWESVGVSPEGSSKHFNLAKAAFCCDGTFECTAEYDGKSETSKGTYKYDRSCLKLMPENGKERCYEARLVGSDKLVVEYEREGHEDIKVTLKRTDCSKDCDKPCCAKGSKGCDEKKSGCGGGKPCCKKS